MRRSLALSLAALFARRGRTILALSSVSAGVAAVTLTSAIGTGAGRDIQRNVESMGTNLIIVRPAQVKRLVARKEVRGSVTSLGLEDYLAIAELPSVSRSAPGVEGIVKVKAGRTTTNTRLLGTSPDFPLVRRFRLQSGRFLDHDDDRNARRVVVLGSRVADALFDHDPVGEQIRIRTIPFDIIGVLAPKGVLADGDEDDQVVIPIRTALHRVFNSTWLNVVFVSASDPRIVAAVQGEIGALLLRRHRASRDGAPDFEIQSAARYFELQRRTANSLTTLSSGLAGIALITGGTGIMALMLMSVKERTSEIGLRIAVGATPRNILFQFLVESTILALGGWIGGIALGAAGATAVSLSTTWNVAAPAEAIAVSFAMAVLIGVGFGAVPARKASLIPPVRALVTK
ncbi:MAG: ABC transporter permease [Gemmatimonadaceae bacterium]